MVTPSTLIAPNLPMMIRQLIAQKAARDGDNFNISQLAKAVNMPHSILVKLLHLDPTKRVTNPRIETLIKIVDFFRQEGFAVSLDDLLAGVSPEQHIDVASQQVGGFSIQKTLSVFSFAEHDAPPIGEVTIKLTQPIEHAVAYFADQDIPPLFKAGSIFVVDTYRLPKEDMMIAVRLMPGDEVKIGKLQISPHRRVLLAFDTHEPAIDISGAEILGVVIQVNAKT